MLSQNGVAIKEPPHGYCPIGEMAGIPPEEKIFLEGEVDIAYAKWVGRNLQIILPSGEVFMGRGETEKGWEPVV